MRNTKTTTVAAAAAASSSFPFMSMLAILFIGLKLVGQIDWSWAWVLSPLWLPFAVFFTVLALVTGIVLVVSFISEVLLSR